MLLERLIAYYGPAGEEEMAYINRMCEMYSDSLQEELFAVITTDNGKKWGFPDLKALKKAFCEVKPDGQSSMPA